MKLSHEKIVHLSHVLVKALEEAPGVSFAKESNDVRLDIVRLLKIELRTDAEIDARARSLISSQKRDIPEGSEEWDILYRKYYDEEMGRRQKVIS